MKFLKLEWQRLLIDRKNFLILIFFFIISIYFVNNEMKEYDQFKEKKRVFLIYEREVLKTYLYWRQYATFGFRVLYEFSPVNVFFANSGLFYNIEGKIDTGPEVHIYHLFKGKDLFYLRVYLKDFSGILFLLGSLYFLYFGSTLFPSLHYIKWLYSQGNFRKNIIASILSRFAILILVFSGLMVMIISLVKIKGLPINEHHILPLFLYYIYLVLFFCFFYIAGGLIRIISKLKATTYLWIFLFWVGSVFLLPEFSRSYIFNESQHLPSNELVALDKFKSMMNFERRAIDLQNSIKQEDLFWKKLREEFNNDQFLLYKNKEADFISQIGELIKKSETVSLLYPSLYFSFFSSEISSKGFYEFLAFFNYFVKMKWDFIAFFWEKRNSIKVESFVKNKENIFAAQAYVPHTYWIGVLVIILYCLLLFKANLVLIDKIIIR